MARVSRVQVHNPGRKRKTTKRRNVGELVTISLPNTGRKRKVARTKKRKTTNAGTRRRRKTTATRRRSSPKVIYRYRTKRSNRGRKTGKRRNSGMLTGKAGQVFGVIGGATVTGLAVNTLVPVQFRTGVMGYISTAAVAMLQGTIAGKVARNSTLGGNMTLGGFVYLALKIVGDMLPGVAGSLPLGLRGLGIISPAQRGNPVIPTAFGTNNMMVPVGPTYQRALPAPSASGNGVGMARAARVGRMR